MVHEHNQSSSRNGVVSQNVRSRAETCRQALEQYCDIVSMGELDDHEMAEYALRLAEVGKTTIATMAIERFTELFPPARPKDRRPDQQDVQGGVRPAARALEGEWQDGGRDGSGANQRPDAQLHPNQHSHEIDIILEASKHNGMHSLTRAAQRCAGRRR